MSEVPLYLPPMSSQRPKSSFVRLTLSLSSSLHRSVTNTLSRSLALSLSLHLSATQTLSRAEREYLAHKKQPFPLSRSERGYLAHTQPRPPRTLQ
jgi:hypothetical protein